MKVIINISIISFLVILVGAIVSDYRVMILGAIFFVPCFHVMVRNWSDNS